MYNISYRGTKEILKLLQKHKIKATFFVTTVFGKTYSALLSRLVEQGHEIAFHGFQHNHNYSTMDTKNAYYYMKNGKEILEKLIHKKIIGFRSPWFHHPPYQILKKLGFKYDSSLHPTKVFRRYGYNNMSKPRNPFFEDGIKIIPISVTPFFRLPFSWVWFRNLGVQYAKICTKLCLLDQNYIKLYFHPYDFVDLNKFEFSDRLPKVVRRNTGKKVVKMLSSYIEWCLRNGLTSSTIKEIFA